LGTQPLKKYEGCATRVQWIMSTAIDKDLSLLRLLSPEVLEHPHVIYRALREYDPVHWDPYTHTWVVTTYSESVQILSDFSSERIPSEAYLEKLGLTVMSPFSEMMRVQMMFMDGPKHRQLRGICSSAFMPNRVEKLREEIESIANGLLDVVAASGQLDLIADFADPLPSIVTARLMGIPLEDRAQVHIWIRDLSELFGNFQHDPERLTTLLESLQSVKFYLDGILRCPRAHTTAGMIQALATAQVDGSPLSSDEIIANIIITLIGGHETTTNLIASGFLTLMENQHAFEQLRHHPESIHTAVEELLRYESPVQHTARIAPCDLELRGKKIAKGDRVVAVLAAANRDPAKFADPDTLDLARADNRHLAFGWASHFCFGAAVARMEAQIAFPILLRRLVNPSLPDSRLSWRQNAGLRGLTRLPIAFETSADN
jgi:pimeloyl-[acyl-carrier protein] synthase